MLAIRCRTAAALVAGVAMSAAALAGPGSRVLILSSGDSGLDGHVEIVLESFGHTATVGPAFNELTDAVDLAEYDVVYFQANANWTAPDMPDSGQASLLTFVNDGGGILTTEWTVWLVNGSFKFQSLNAAFAADSTGGYSSVLSTTYSVATPDPIINDGLSDTLSFTLTSFSGTETEMMPRAKAGAQTFYTSSTYPTAAGLVGIPYGNGRVLHMSVCVGADSLGDQGFQRLLSNCVNWLHGAPTFCPADFNRDSAVNSQDFFDFLAAFFENDPTADFNDDDAVNSQDFFDFLTAFFGAC